jgi:hypothetical protein
MKASNHVEYTTMGGINISFNTLGEVTTGEGAQYSTQSP